jgi:PIN domain nuclease of toxin-antitoxin system
MRLLLDTHILLWALGTPNKLDNSVNAMLEDPANEVLFSAASIWEIAIKFRLGRRDFGVSPGTIRRTARNTGFVELAVSAQAAERVATMPLYHRDPFDRLLIAQATDADAQFYTADPELVPYSERIILV